MRIGIRPIVHLFFFISLFLVIGITPAYAQQCTVPTAPANLRIEYPQCDGGNCDPTKGRCSWDAVAGATSYNVTITEVETSTVLQNNASVSATESSFAVNNGNTYKCDVAAVSSCGTGAVATTSLLCKADAPTAVPTQAPQQPIVTLPETGSHPMILFGIGGIMLTVIGSLVFFAFL